MKIGKEGEVDGKFIVGVHEFATRKWKAIIRL